MYLAAISILNLSKMWSFKSDLLLLGFVTAKTIKIMLFFMKFEIYLLFIKVTVW